MKKNRLSLKETFNQAKQNYKNKNFNEAQIICYKILSIDHNHFESKVLLADILAKNKNFKDAIKLLKEAADIQPNNVKILNNLGTASKEMGDQENAVKYYKKVLEIDHKNANAYYNLGTTAHELKDLKNAIKYFKKTTELQSNFALPHFVLGNIYVDLKDYQNAVSNYQKAIEINKNLVGAHNNLGLAFKKLNDFENAVSCYREAIKIKSDHVGSHHNLAMALKELGKFEESITALENAIKFEPENASHYFYLSEMKEDILIPKLKSKIEKIIQNQTLSKTNLAFANYLLSKFEQKSKNYKKEFSYLTKGHNCFFDSKKVKFDLRVKYSFEDVLQISKGVKVDKVDKVEKKYENKIRPIFIVGVPRCGSTLIEKIIGSGPESILMGEEIEVVENFINSKILEKKSLNLGPVEKIRNELIECYQQKELISEKFNYIFTDKSLNNFFYLDLIKTIFPEAKIIHCKRNLLSSIISIFQNNMSELAWAHDLDNIFKYFDNYIKTMKEFNSKYPGYLCEIQFEELTNNPEEESKKIMQFCNLEWDKKCLEFYKRKDLISKTASNIQIRKAIYKNQPDKYLPYKKFLEKYKEKYTWFK